MVRIRSDILYKRKIKEIDEGQKQAQRLHIASPILDNQEDDSSEEEDSEEDSEDLNVSDLDDDDLDNDSDEEETKDDFHWSEICDNWINLVVRKNQFDNKEDKNLLEMTYDFLAAGRSTHPADDETAKWNLEYLFQENLKAPTFLGLEFYFSNLNSKM